MTEPKVNADSLITITSRPDLMFVKGEGSWLIDSDGHRYLDFIQGWAVNCLGHCPPALVEAIQQQAATLINASPALFTDQMISLADNIAQNSCFDRVFFANSGAEANEGAIKLARKWGAKHRQGAYKIITTENSFHGRTLATMSASGKPQFEPLFEPKVPGFTKVPLNNIDAVEQAIDDQTVAVMLELVQGEGGVNAVTQEYISALRELTSKKGILLIADEVQTGIGRLGTLFGYQHFGIEPDIMTLGKGLGGGVPVAALVAKEAVSCFEPGDQGGTYNGNALVTAAATAVFDTVKNPEFLADVNERAKYLRQGLLDLCEKHGHNEVRGEGFLQAIVLSEPKAVEMVQVALEQYRIILNAVRPEIIRFIPSLTVSKQEIDQVLQALDAIMSEFG